MLLLLSTLLFGAYQTDPPPDAELVIRQIAPDEQADYLTLETAFTLPGEEEADFVTAAYQLGERTLPAELVYAGPEPFYVALLIDTSGSMGPALEAVRRSAAALVEAAPPQAHFAVIGFDSRLSKQLDFSNDRAAIAAALAGLQSQGGGTCLYDAVQDTLAALDRFDPLTGATTATAAARRAVVVFSDGRDELRDDRPQVRSRLAAADTTAVAAALSIPVHTVYAAGRAPGRAEQMAGLARASGGRAVALADATLTDFYDALMADFTRQWRATARFYLAPAGQHRGQLAVMRADGRRAQTAFIFTIDRPHMAPPVLTLHTVDYQEAAERLRLSFSFHDLPAIENLLIEVIDRAGTESPIEETIYVSNLAPNQHHTLVLTAALRRDHGYRVRLTPLAAGQPILTGENQHVSAERSYDFRPAPVDLRIESIALSPWRFGRPQTVTAQVSADTFTPIDALDGYLLRQPDGDTATELYRFQPDVAEAVTTSIPGGGGRYTIVLIARTAQGDTLGTAVHEFDASARWLERGWQTLVASPWLLAVAALPPLLALLLIGLGVARRPRSGAAGAAADAPPAPASGPRLRVETSAHTALVGQTVPLTAFPFTIGREGCSLNLPDDKQLSRRHAQITAAADNALLLSDLGSGHGTFLDGRRLAAGESALLAAQRSVIQVGKATTLVFEQEV